MINTKIMKKDRFLLVLPMIGYSRYQGKTSILVGWLGYLKVFRIGLE